MASLLEKYELLIKYIIAPIIQNPQDREDCFSEISMKIWENIKQYDESKGSLSAWITTIARNTAINHTRKISYHEDIESIELVSNSMPEKEILNNELKASIERAIHRLKPNEQRIFYRKYYYLQSTNQIAEELGMTNRAVEGKLYRIKKKLRKLLGGDFYEV
ncbi:RNA polymerase sigma factor [Lachnospiraceae bacterium TWA4]|nr:RNA polymerase sigma factor [Lachnospiraceae bacterium TWA4]